MSSMSTNTVIKSFSWVIGQRKSDRSMHILAFLAFSALFATIQSIGDMPGENLCSVFPVNGDGPGCEITRCPESDIMNCPDEHTLEQGYLLRTFPLGKWWKISLEFHPLTKLNLTEKSNILKLSSTGGGTGSQFGILSIFTLPDQDLCFSGTHGDKAWSKNYNGTQVGIWTKISFSQIGQNAKNENCLKYQQVIKINGKELGRRINRAPQEFDQVDLDLGEKPWRSQPGVIRNFVLETRNAGQMGNTFFSITKVEITCIYIV